MSCVLFTGIWYQVFVELLSQVILSTRTSTLPQDICINNLTEDLHLFFIKTSPLFLSFFLPGAFQFVFKIEGTISIIIASVPPVFYIIVCFVTKSNTQITIAAIMSVLYAFLMTASFFSIIGGYKSLCDFV